MILKDHLPVLFSMFVFARDSKLIWSHMIVFFETFIKMSCGKSFGQCYRSGRKGREK